MLNLQEMSSFHMKACQDKEKRSDWVRCGVTRYRKKKEKKKKERPDQGTGWIVTYIVS